MQAFVNHSFENISSTGLALDLLLQFETILQRDTLKVRKTSPATHQHRQRTPGP